VFFPRIRAYYYRMNWYFHPKPHWALPILLFHPFVILIISLFHFIFYCFLLNNDGIIVDGKFDFIAFIEIAQDIFNGFILIKTGIENFTAQLLVVVDHFDVVVAFQLLENIVKWHIPE